MRKLAVFVGLAWFAVWGLTGCTVQAHDTDPAESGPTVTPGVALLRKSLATYGTMPSFSAVAHLTFSMASGVTSETESAAERASRQQIRKINIDKLKRFRLTSTNGNGFVMMTICNGTSVLEYDNYSSTMPTIGSAPRTIADADSSHMINPRASGSLLYTFFGGLSHYDNLVDESRQDVTVGGEETVAGERAQVVRFMARQSYGHVEALIGETSGNIYRLRYDGGSLYRNIPGRSFGPPSVHPAIVKVSNEVQLGWSEEDYTNIRHPAGFSPTAFRLDAPKGTVPFDTRAMSGIPPRAPVEEGQPAPMITVQRLDGAKVNLASLRGHPVLLYFWTPWNAPSVAGLHSMDEYARQGEDKGLKILVISGENTREVASEIKRNGYTFPTYVDAFHEGREQYNLVRYPTTVILDAKGNLADYITGGMKNLAIVNALSEIGIDID